MCSTPAPSSSRPERVKVCEAGSYNPASTSVSAATTMISREPTIERLAIARSLLLEPFGLSEATLASALATIATHRIDDADLYFQLSLIHISEPTRLLSISYAVFCLKKKK